MLKSFKKHFFRKKGRDRRKYVRLRAHHLLKYKILSPQEHLTFVRDISGGGLLFFSREDIPVGSVVELAVNFPASPLPIEGVAKVIRTRHLKKMGGYEIAVEFLELDEENRERIQRQIACVYEKKEQRKGERMGRVAKIFLGLAIVGALFGTATRFFDVSVPVAPLSWVMLTNMFLLFSIAVTLLAIARKIK
ncbi:MAG: hypothetical protein GF333_01690 [Candidatus Omnitrophica bacterium]|nr:hypothetical protein [Candidatus Omnitrophota bacterium]